MSDAWQESKPTHAHSRHARRRPTPRPDRGSVRRLPQWLAVIAIGMSALPSSTTRVHAFQPYLNPLDHNHKHRIGGAERWRKPGFCSRWTDESSPLPTRILSSFASSTDETSFVEADDLEALQSLFTKYSDKEGLMAKTDALKVPAIASLLADGDLLPEEFDDIWEKVPKFPDDTDRVDVDSFVQVYRDIDDLFEEDEDDDNQGSSKKASIDTKEDNGNETVQAELEVVFADICDGNGFLSRDALRAWPEVQTLLEDSLLGEDEFDAMWSQTVKVDNKLNLSGFLSFNAALDELFDFEDEDMMEDDDDEDIDEAVNSPSATENLVVQGDMSPLDLFAAIATAEGTVSLVELQRWSELEDMLAEGDLLSSELEAMYNSIVTDDGSSLGKAGFLKLYQMIDDLFEDAVQEDGAGEAVPSTPASRTKEELLEALEELNDYLEEGSLPCGLDASDREQRAVLELVSRLEQEPTNWIQIRDGNIGLEDLAGSWKLLYSSSSAMKFNKGLSGLGGSFPNGRFAGLKQTLKASKYLTDVEYKERIEVNPSSASFDVTVNGDWALRSSVSLFTGDPSIVLQVTPDRVEYGPTSTRADHWKSLGPMNMLDIVYLDDTLRVMRGNTSVDTVFIFVRCED